MTQLTIDKDLQALAKFLGVVPPEEWKVECWTQDQREHWAKVHYDYELIFEDFASSIRGVQSSLDEMNLKKPYREYIRSRTRAYKTLFSALWEGWPEVNRVLQNADPNEVNISDRMPRSPGEVVFAIVLQDARIAFRRCLLTHCQLSSNQLKKSVERKRRVGQLNALPPCEKSEKEIDALSWKIKNVGLLAGVNDYRCLRDLIFPVLEKKFRNDRSEHPLRTYRRHIADVEKAVVELNQSRHKLGGETWSNGVRQTTGEGDKYVIKS